MLCKMIILQVNHQERVIYLKIIHYQQVKIINIQSYANYAFNKMFKDNVKEDDICFIKKEVSIVWYEENNKKHRHYVDFFIKSLNKCIEVKLILTFEKKKECFNKTRYK